VPVCRPAVSHDDYFRPDSWSRCMGSAFRCASSAARAPRFPLLLTSLAIAGLSRRCGRSMLLLIAHVRLTFAKKLGHPATPPISPMEEMPRSLYLDAVGPLL
jgi:hypothetical protein